MNRIKAYGYALLLGALLVASSMPIAFKLGSAIPTMTLMFYISLVGVATSFLLMVANKGLSQLKGIFKNKNHLLSLVATGTLVFAIEPLALAYATHYVNADLAAVIFRTWPIFLVLLAPFVIRERITKWDLIGVLVGFLGLASTLISGTAISLPLYELPFVAVLLCAAFVDALSTAISKRYNYELTSSIFVYNIISLVIFAPLAVYTNTWQLKIMTPDVIFSILFLGILTEAVFAYMFYEALRLVKTSIASTSFIACSFMTLILSFVFLGEAIKPYYIVIAATVVAGVLIQKFAPKSTGNFITSRKKKGPGLFIYDVTPAFINTHHPAILKTMKGNGRVLAIFANQDRSSERINEHLQKLGNSDILLFTDRTKGIATKSELDFTRDIMGGKNDRLLILGSGNPDDVVEKFQYIQNAIDDDNSTLPPM
jgi:drug/metabolite transporter (DMT)-like permease